MVFVPGFEGWEHLDDVAPLGEVFEEECWFPLWPIEALFVVIGIFIAFIIRPAKVVRISNKPNWVLRSY